MRKLLAWLTHVHDFQPADDGNVNWLRCSCGKPHYHKWGESFPVEIDDEIVFLSGCAECGAIRKTALGYGETTIHLPEVKDV